MTDFLPFCTELNTGQIQESIGEAVNGIVKHFHKPEKEVRITILGTKKLDISFPDIFVHANYFIKAHNVN